MTDAGVAGKVLSYDFTGQVAFVTGASQGIGLAAAQAFAHHGAAVMLADVQEDKLQEVVASLASQGHHVASVKCDVSDEEAVATAIESTVSTFGRLDMAFNNAGIQVPAADAAEELGEWFDKVTAVNLKGVWACMKYELAHMRERGSGAIVNCSSLGGLVGIPKFASYHATKHGVIGLTGSAALEYAPRGIRINAVCPGTISTPMMRGMVERGELDEEAVVALAPIGRLGQPEEIANAVMWLCSPGASYVVGVALPVDGGYVAR
jgi:NAD(P)-dependent dehydrogenase (short-subunit alcohol dehydrogenase family)